MNGITQRETNETAITTTTSTTSKPTFHKYNNSTLADKRLCGTTRDLYDFMLAQSHIYKKDFCMTIEELGEGITKSPNIARYHLNRLIRMGYVTRILRKDATRRKWNLKSRFIVHDTPLDTILPDPVEYVNQYTYTYSKKLVVPTPKNNEGKDKRELKENNINITLTREAEKLPEKNDEKENTVQAITSTTDITPITEPDPTPKAKPETHTTPTRERKEKTTNQEVFDLTGVPDIMRSTAKLLLYQSGRSSLRPQEAEILRKLADIHTPTRVNREIDLCVERFNRLGKPLHNLTFEYLWSYLQHQNSLDAALSPAKKGRRRNKKPVQEPPKAEQEQTAVELTMPLEQAEKVLSDYTPEQPSKQEVPVALLELHQRIQDKTSELTDEYVESLPKDENGETVWPKAEEEHWPSLTVADYLRLKFPEAEEEELRTGYYGVRESAEGLADYKDIEKALEIDTACANCENPDNCPLERRLGKGVVRPHAVMKTNQRGKKYVCVCYSEGICKHVCRENNDPEFERRLERSGITRVQAKQTFERYKHGHDTPEIVVAKAQSVLAAKNHTSLILAGKSGTGKTHLAIAIALETMRGGKQALFRTVPEMLDELRLSWQKRDYFNVKQKFMDVPCLVLDDLGKERTTQAGMEYLHQIIDYRYRHGMQTIITTNALDMEGLKNRWNADRIEPLISRVLENGVWVAISQGENYRLRKPENPSECVTDTLSESVTENPSGSVTENLSENVDVHPVTDAEMISHDYDGYDDEDNEENGYGYYYEDGSDEEDDLMLYGDTGIPASVWEEFRIKKEQGM